MKRNIFILILLFFAACNNKPKEMPNVFEDNANHFSIRYPGNWKFDSTMFVIREDLSAVEDDFQEKIVMGFEKLPTIVSAKTYAQSVTSTYKILDSGFSLISADTFLHPNFNVQKIVFTTLQNDTKYKSAVYVLLKDSFAYTLQCNATDTSFASHIASFDKIIFSANFIK
jgi:hypothetical protein